MTEHKIPIPGRIYNASGGNVCGTDDVIDDVKGKKQSQINTEVDNAIQNEIERATEAENNRYTKSEVYKKEETYNKTELNNMITTPEVEYVNVEATNQTTDISDVLPATGAADTIYKIGCWNGSQYDTSKYSEYTWNGSAYVYLTTRDHGVDDKPTVGSNNLVKSGGIADMYGSYVENPEFICVKTDAQNKILWGIKTDGTIYYGVGIPPQVVDYIQQKIEELSLDEYEDIVAFLDGLEEGDKTLQTLLNEKVDKEEGKSLTTNDYDDTAKSIVDMNAEADSQEFIRVETDSNEKILEDITKDGRKEIHIPVDFHSCSFDSTSNQEWMNVQTDSQGNILEGLNKGKKYLAFPSNQDDIIKKDVNEIKNEISTVPTFVTTQEFNQITGDKCNMKPYYLFTDAVLINHGKISKDLTDRNYYTKIGLFGDPHVDYTISGAVITEPPVDERVELAVNHLNNLDIDFGFSIGDNTTIESYPIREEYKQIFYNRIKGAKYPFFSIVGNHDRMNGDFTERGVIEINNVRIICFDANFVVVPSMGPTHNSRGDVTDATMEWLTNAVKDSYQKGFITILACHYPLAHTDIHEVTFEESIRNHREDIISLCQQYDVKLYIGGHEHGTNLEYMIVSDDDITLDMMNVQLGLSYTAFSTLVIDSTGFHFISFDSVTGEQLHTLYVPFENQAQGTIYE